MEALILQLLDQGLVGLIAAAALWIAYRKDRQTDLLYVRLIKKTEKQMEKYHELAAEMTETVKELARAQTEMDEKVQKVSENIRKNRTDGTE